MPPTSIPNTNVITMPMKPTAPIAIEIGTLRVISANIATKPIRTSVIAAPRRVRSHQARSRIGVIGSGVTTDFIKETQVKTAGFEAEYGQATGGVVNVVTKSGTNNFSGSLFGYARPGALEGEWEELDSPNGTVRRSSSPTRPSR